MKELLIATTNQGKILEYKAILKELDPGIKAVSLQDLKINQEVEETGRTFEENAVIKASFYYNLSGLPTLADDAGIEIDYLNGEPGVLSRRWPGHEATDEEIIQIALEKLKGVPVSQRGAQLRAVIAFIFSKPENYHVFEGILRGHIAESPTKKRIAGYPFRSIFIPAGGDKYLGDMSLVAHRKQAMEKALPIIKKHLC